MSVFPDMVNVIPEGAHGSAKVEHFEVSAHESALTSFHGGRTFVPEGKYARLYVDGSLFMSDTRYERTSNLEIVRRAHGHVLIAGLGLGMILVPILKKPEVESVTVVEKSADVIALIGRHFDAKNLVIINADIYEWKPANAEKFNVIYFDIWADTSTDDLADMGKLHRRFAEAVRRAYDTFSAALVAGNAQRSTLRGQLYVNIDDAHQSIYGTPCTAKEEK